MSSAQGGADERHPAASGSEASPMLSAAFAAGGELGERLATFDWSSGPLGTPGQWPVALSNAVGMMLASSAPIAMFWGDDHLAFYNDAYRPTIGAKHPYAIGQPARASWAETWPVLGRCSTASGPQVAPTVARITPSCWTGTASSSRPTSTSRTTRSAAPTVRSVASTASSARPPDGCSASAGCGHWPNWAPS